MTAGSTVLGNTPVSSVVAPQVLMHAFWVSLLGRKFGHERCSGFGRVSHKTCFVSKMILVYDLGLVFLPCQIHCKGYRFAPPCLVQYRSLMLTRYLDFIGIRIIRK